MYDFQTALANATFISEDQKIVDMVKNLSSLIDRRSQLRQRSQCDQPDQQNQAAQDEKDLLGDDIVNLLGDLMQATDETAIDPQDCLIPLAHRLFDHYCKTKNPDSLKAAVEAWEQAEGLVC